jgi:FeS assembly protein IscX
MKLIWKDAEEIAWALLDRYPDQNPLLLSFPKLQKMVTELPDFADNPQTSNEAILEAIQMAWHEEKQ